MKKNILLASFVKKEQLDEALTSIEEKLCISRNRVFIFSSDILSEYILTYNIDSENANVKFGSIWKGTISIHRKKETNTLFSINAMNEVIKKNNNGVLNQQYKINWSSYSNTFLLIRNGKISTIPISLVKLNR